MLFIDIIFVRILNIKKKTFIKTNKKISKCPICDSHDTEEWYSSNAHLDKVTFTYEFTPQSQKTFRVVRCHNCTHVFCSPVPKDIYKKYEDVIDEEYLKHAKTRRLSGRAVLQIISGYKPSGRLLDVGCATGDFLIVAQKFGYEAEGLELSEWSTKIARDNGLKIYKQRLKSLADRFSQRYDIITLWGVIEHFENPKEEMKYLNKLLKPGGLLVLWTGDVDGPMSRLLRRRWWYWQGQHIQYFTHLSLNSLAKICGFVHIKTNIYPIAVTYKQMKSSLGRYRLLRLAAIIIKPFFIVKPIWYLRLPGEMFWIAKKSKQVK